MQEKRHSSGPTVAEAQQRLKSWGSQVALAEEIEKCMALSRSSVTGSSDLLGQDVLSLEPSEPADSILLAPSSQDEVDVVEEGEDPADEELLDVMMCGMTRLDLVWGCEIGSRL